MKYDHENIIAVKSKRFAIRCVRLYEYLQKEGHERVLGNQLLRSGTSIGANIKEALRGQSTADFAAKMNIALKEANESEYWIEILHEVQYISTEQFESLNADCHEIIKILMAIVKHTNTKI